MMENIYKKLGGTGVWYDRKSFVRPGRVVFTSTPGHSETGGGGGEVATEAAKPNPSAKDVASAKYKFNRESGKLQLEINKAKTQKTKDELKTAAQKADEELKIETRKVKESKDLTTEQVDANLARIRAILELPKELEKLQPDIKRVADLRTAKITEWQNNPDKIPAGLLNLPVFKDLVGDNGKTAVDALQTQSLVDIKNTIEEKTAIIDTAGSKTAGDLALDKGFANVRADLLKTEELLNGIGDPQNEINKVLADKSLRVPAYSEIFYDIGSSGPNSLKNVQKVREMGASNYKQSAEANKIDVKLYENKGKEITDKAETALSGFNSPQDTSKRALVLSVLGSQYSALKKATNETDISSLKPEYKSPKNLIERKSITDEDIKAVAKALGIEARELKANIADSPQEEQDRKLRESLKDMPKELVDIIAGASAEYREALITIARDADKTPRGADFKLLWNNQSIPCWVNKRADGQFGINFVGSKNGLGFKTVADAMRYIADGTQTQRMTLGRMLVKSRYDNFKDQIGGMIGEIDAEKDKGGEETGVVRFTLDWSGGGKGSGNASVQAEAQPNGMIGYKIIRDGVGLGGGKERSGYAANFDDFMKQIARAKVWAEKGLAEAGKTTKEPGPNRAEYNFMQISNPELFKNPTVNGNPMDIGQPINFKINNSGEVEMVLDWGGKDASDHVNNAVVTMSVSGNSGDIFYSIKYNGKDYGYKVNASGYTYLNDKHMEFRDAGIERILLILEATKKQALTVDAPAPVAKATPAAPESATTTVPEAPGAAPADIERKGPATVTEGTAVGAASSAPAGGPSAAAESTGESSPKLKKVETARTEAVKAQQEAVAARDKANDSIGKLKGAKTEDDKTKIKAEAKTASDEAKTAAGTAQRKADEAKKAVEELSQERAKVKKDLDDAQTKLDAATKSDKAKPADAALQKDAAEAVKTFKTAKNKFDTTDKDLNTANKALQEAENAGVSAGKASDDAAKAVKDEKPVSTPAPATTSAPAAALGATTPSAPANEPTPWQQMTAKKPEAAPSATPEAGTMTPEQKVAEAKKYLQEGHKLFNDGQLAAAEPLFRKANELQPHSNAEYYLAYCLEEQGKKDPTKNRNKFQEASTIYKSFVDANSSPTPGSTRAQSVVAAKEAIIQLQEKLEPAPTAEPVAVAAAPTAPKIATEL